MATWIFQGNPAVFDLEGYLRAVTEEITWRVVRYADDIVIGDDVFLWKSQGADREAAGIVAKCTVVERPKLQLDDPVARPFWRGEPDLAESVRCRLHLVGLASKKEVLKRDWLREDSALRNLLILRQAAGTNFPVEETEAQRLNVLWAKTGQDWSRDEVIAALHLYADLWDKPVSRGIGSPVEQLAQKIGRVPTGVYNKLMNLRSLDPRVEQKGLPSVGNADRQVWAEFFDVPTMTLNQPRLELEFARLWRSAAGTEASVADTEQEVRRLSEKSLDELMAAYQNRKQPKKPARRTTQQAIYDRSALVIAIARKRAESRCEVSGCTSPTFLTDEDAPFVEIHHLLPLANGGDDTIANAACLCPIHHREIHYGVRRQELTDQLRARRAAELEA
jgi:hypothetical protein